MRCGRCCLCTPGAIFRSCVRSSVETADVKTCAFLSVDAAMSLCNIEVKLKKYRFCPEEFTLEGYTAVFMWYCAASVELLMFLR